MHKLYKLKRQGKTCVVHDYRLPDKVLIKSEKINTGFDTALDLAGIAE